MVTQGQVAGGLSVFCPGTPGGGQGRQEKERVVTGTWWRDVVAAAGRSLPGLAGDLGFAFRNGSGWDEPRPARAGLPQLRG